MFSKHPCHNTGVIAFWLHLRRCGVAALAASIAWSAVLSATEVIADGTSAFHVFPGGEIQDALDLAAKDKSRKHVIVHEGTYRPASRRQALIWLNAGHDGIVLEAKGRVVLTGANPEIADPDVESFPAVVNHVVYIGHGVGSGTIIRGFKITGANNFVTDKEGDRPIEPHFDELRKTEGYYGRLFFFTDGGGIKIFGRSSPTIENVEISNSYSNPCGGGISIEQRGFRQTPVSIRNCVFRNNRALVTGSAVDLLPGSAARIENCLFVGNISNSGARFEPVEGNIDWPEIPGLMASAVGYQPKHGSGALTVFFNSVVDVRRCTFTGNFNGVDDMGEGSRYLNCIFWRNTAEGGVRTGGRYELSLKAGAHVNGCFVNGNIGDLRGTVSAEGNTFACSDPEFDEGFVPRNEVFQNAGYRPVIEAGDR